MTSTETILVTGAQGFTGRYLCQALRKQGYRVVGTSYQDTDTPDIYACDISDPQSIEELVLKVKPDRVVHLAALSFANAQELEAYYRINVIGTCHLLSALEKVNPRQILIASSANVYGQPEHGKSLTENDPSAPINHYAASKLAMEHMAKTFSDRLPIVITRPFNYTGPGQDENFLVSKMVAHFINKAPKIELGNIEISRDFSSISDVVDAYIRILRSDLRDETLNICSGKAISLKQIFLWLTEITGHHMDIEVNPAFIRKNDIHTLVGDHTRLSTLTGWQPTQTFKDVLAEMLVTHTALS